MIGYILLILLGFALLIKGADFLVDGASNIAKKFKIPTIIIGLTIVAIGTSMPELMVSATAAIGKHSDMSVGNVVGSNISNLFCILGVCSIIKSLKFKKETEKYEAPITILATIFLLISGNNNYEHIITKAEGGILIGCCMLFIGYNIVMAKKSRDEVLVEINNDESKNISIIKAVINIVVGIIALKFGGDLVVNYASKIAEIMGLSEKLISLTIIAFSTSLPELITSINATCKGETDMAIGNILGSQIFNILLIIGTSAILCPIEYSIEYNKDLIILLIGTIMFAIFPNIGKKHEMTRANGIIFVSIYIAYMVSLCMSAILK